MDELKRLCKRLGIMRPELFDCPMCFKPSDFLNVREEHWGYCVPCNISWQIGETLFSSWHKETKKDWKRNAEFLMQFDGM